MKKFLSALLVLLVFPAIFQMFLPGFFASDDGEWMVIRFSSFYQELVNFQIPVRYLHRLNNGYGYPVATFLYPGFMYLGSILKVIGFSFVEAIKGVFILSICGAFFGMYLFLKGRFSTWAAIVGSVLYIYHPYFLWDVYSRGSVGEVLALGIVPFAFYFVDRQQRIIAAALSAFLIISHNTLAILFFPIIAAYLIVNQISNKISFSVLLVRLTVYILFSLGISAFFWIPAIFELPFTIFKTVAVSNFSNYFVSDFKMISIVHILVLFSSYVYLFVKGKHSLVLYLMLGVGTISLYLSLSFSAFFWTDGILGKYVQFPFRFLSLFTFSLAYLGAFIFSSIKYKISLFAFFALGFIMVSAYPFVSNVKHNNIPDSYYSTNMDTTTVKNEYMPIWVTEVPMEISSTRIERIDEQVVQINTIYWPGYKVKSGGEEIPIDYSNKNGVITVSTAEPLENIEVVFAETKLRLMSDIVSIITLLISSVLLFKKYSYV